MLHLGAYTANQGIGATLVGLNAIADGAITIFNNHLILARQLNLYMMYLMGTGISDARMSTPSIRVPVQPDLFPVDTVTQPGNDPNVIDLIKNPFPLPPREEITIQTTNTNAAAQQHYAFLLMGDQLQRWDGRAPVYTVKCTAAITAVANAWTSGTLTFGQSLPAGQYAVLGAWGTSTTMLAFRLIFPDVGIYRPGMLASSGYGKRGPFSGRKGELGIWGTFVNTALPLVEILCTAADTSETFMLDIAKIG